MTIMILSQPTSIRTLGSEPLDIRPFQEPGQYGVTVNGVKLSPQQAREAAAALNATADDASLLARTS